MKYKETTPYAQPALMSPTSIRFAPHLATPSEIEAANAAQSLQGARAYESVERSLRTIEHAFRALSAPRLEALLNHPDERVAIAVADKLPPNSVPVLCTLERTPEVIETLLQRARASAKEEGVLWNPLLDALIGDVDNAHTSKDKKRREKNLPLAELRREVEENTDPEWLRQVLRLRTTEIRTLAAQESRAISEEVLSESLQDPSLYISFARNPSLTPEQNERLLNTALELLSRCATLSPSERREYGYILTELFAILAEKGVRLTSEQRKYLRSLLNENSHKPGLDDREQRMRWYIHRHSLDAITAFHADFPLEELLALHESLKGNVLTHHTFTILMDPRADEKARRRILACFRNSNLEAECIASHLFAEPEIKDWLLATDNAYTLEHLATLKGDSDFQQKAILRLVSLCGPSFANDSNSQDRRKRYLELLLKMPRSREIDAAIYEQVKDDSSLLSHLITQPETHIEVCRRAAKETRSRTLRMNLSLQQRLCTDPEIRSTLLGSTDAYLLRNLVSTATAEELNRIASRIGAKRPHLLLQVLSDTSAEMLKQVDAEVLLPVLASQSQQNRLHAMQLLHQMRTSPTSGEKPETTPRRAQRKR